MSAAQRTDATRTQQRSLTHVADTLITALRPVHPVLATHTCSLKNTPHVGNLSFSQSREQNLHEAASQRRSVNNADGSDRRLSPKLILDPLVRRFQVEVKLQPKVGRVSSASQIYCACYCDKPPAHCQMQVRKNLPNC